MRSKSISSQFAGMKMWENASSLPRSQLTKSEIPVNRAGSFLIWHVFDLERTDFSQTNRAKEKTGIGFSRLPSSLFESN